jgi:5-formyltetrahydrofolate cyclo-ligase
MMKVSFSPRERSRAIGPGICFFLLIVIGWIPPLWLMDASPLSIINTEPFELIAQGDLLEVTPSLLYTAFIVLFYSAGAGIASLFLPVGSVPAAFPPGFEYGVMTFALGQSLLLILVCAGVCTWLYLRGTPLWLCLAIALVAALLSPFSRLVVQPNEGVMVVACLILLTFKLIAAVGDNCAGLRKTSSVTILFSLLAVLLFLDLSLVVVVIPTLLVLCLTPTRVKGWLGLSALATVAVCAAFLLIVFPQLGWTSYPSASLMATRVAGVLTNANSLFAAAFLVALIMELATLAALVWVLSNRRPRYLLPFVPLLSFGMLCLFSGPQQGREAGLLAGVFALCVPVLLLIPLMREYSETKDTLRQRFLTRQAEIMGDERAQQSERACGALLEKLQGLSPDAGYIGLYLARGYELSLNLLAVRLGFLGYRVAYPIVLSDSQIAFFTTLGLSDEELFDLMLEDRLFDWESSTEPVRLTRVEPSELSALVVPGIAFDKDHYRLGRGAGRYDRYIAHLGKGVPTWGVGFAAQLTEAVPVERHDLPLTGVVLG